MSAASAGRGDLRVALPAGAAEARSLRATITGVDLALVNSLRRVVLADVPYVALLHEPYGAGADGSRFAFLENTGALHNHILGHRMSMVPLHLSRGEAAAYIPGSIKVRLAAANEGRRAMDVTTAHAAVTLHDQPHPDTARLYPADPLSGDRPLVTVLKPGERVALEATAVRGTAARHAAFGVASLCSFRPLLDEARVSAGRAAAEAAPQRERALNRFEHIERLRCWQPGPDGHPSAFEFSVESECGMSALDIMLAALDVLHRKAVTATGRLVAGGDAGGDAGDDAGAGGGAGGAVATVEVAGEDHTLGNLLHSTAMDELVGDGLPMSYAGYYVPHPLEQRFLFKLVAAGGDALAAFEAAKAATAARVAQLREALTEEAARVAQA